MKMTKTNIQDEKNQGDYVFAMDIGTRSIIGMAGVLEEGRLKVTAIEKAEHDSRAMVDGQIENIAGVARVASIVKERLEEKLQFKLERVHVAAAGRALRTQRASFELDLKENMNVTEEVIRTLETGAITTAEEEFEKADPSVLDKQFYLVGYSVSQYYLDNYPISSLLNHKGRNLKADIIATFLPGEVVESLYTAMQEAGMEVASMTLEPIASMNASVPQKLRLLNLALVDIGAGTSDIAVASEGSIAGYTMATTAGDEITECLMRTYLVDFDTAENLKMNMGGKEELNYRDVLGMEHTITAKEVLEAADASVQSLCKQIADRILEVNGGAPSAVFLAGGGSKLTGVREYVAQYLDMDLNRVALGGNNYSVHAYSDEYDLKDPEYSTPLGIAVSAALNLISDSFYIKLNGQRAKLFRSGKLTIRDVLMMNGYGYKHMMSRSGQSLILYIEGKRTVIAGGYAVPAVLTLNGEPAGISDVVKAGDEIGFEPAYAGTDASACLKDVVVLEEKGTVSWNGGEITLGTTADVNDVPGTPDMQLKSGDRIQVHRIYTAGELAEFCQINGNVVVNGAAVPPDWVLEPGDMIGGPESKPPKEDKAHAEEEAGEKEKQKEKSYEFRLNGVDLKLSEKKNASPYYVIDMLAHVDLDLSKPEGVIILKVNGDEAGFQTELKDKDVIEIYWSAGTVKNK